MWYNLKLIPKQVNVREGFLTPEQYAQITPKEVLAQNAESQSKSQLYLIGQQHPTISKSNRI
ncbi:hypothetical protein AMR41_03155 [Hapalosiphon sp. MRB220]|nr:hypothetical protein AMR41_03155 [Hapalosiphon sp. MRB220]